jgi:hypothetical protein
VAGYSIARFDDLSAAGRDQPGISSRVENGARHVRTVDPPTRQPRSARAGLGAPIHHEERRLGVLHLDVPDGDELGPFDMAANERLTIAGSHPAFPGIGHVAKAATGYAYVPIEWARTWDHPCRPVTIGVPTARVAGNKPQSIVRALPDYGVVTTWKTDQRTATNKAGDCVDPHSGIRCPDYGVAS